VEISAATWRSLKGENQRNLRNFMVEEGDGF
jgi:hypothetical protein